MRETSHASTNANPPLRIATVPAIATDRPSVTATTPVVSPVAQVIRLPSRASLRDDLQKTRLDRFALITDGGEHGVVPLINFPLSSRQGIAPSGGGKRSSGEYMDPRTIARWASSEKNQS